MFVCVFFFFFFICAYSCIEQCMINSFMQMAASAKQQRLVTAETVDPTRAAGQEKGS
jgi:hypothetical protein